MKTDAEKYNETVQPNTAFLSELKDKLPQFFTKNGSFNLEKFKEQLEGKNINELSEGYQLNFIGKNYARRQAGEMPGTVIVPDEKQNQGEGKNSKNLFFTGDNLEVLRHLQNNYQNKIDVIYIDPPYNTGKDGFVYPDSFEYSDDQLKDMFGLDDKQIERLKSIQGKSSHSAWLTFMLPRLALAKNLLSNNGIIYISIDDNEQAQLKLLCDDVLGEINFVADVIWKHTQQSKNDEPFYARMYNHTLAYAKNINYLHPFYLKRTAKDNINYSNPDNDPKGAWRSGDVRSPNLRETLKYNLMAPNGNTIFPPKNGWRWSKNTMDKKIKSGEIIFKPDNSGIIRKIYLANQKGRTPENIWAKGEAGTTRSATSHLKELFDGISPFGTPKPVELIKRFLELQDGDSYTVLDFFAGSATTADAVMQLNAEDGGHRKFIMVQLPEKTYYTNKKGKEVPTKGGKASYEAGYKTIDEIARERIRRAAYKIRTNRELEYSEDFDGSFKHFRVVKPAKQTLENINNFDPSNMDLFTNMVDGFSSESLNVSGNASGEQTILATWLARDGYKFDVNVKNKDFGSYHAYYIDNRLYLINEGWGSKQTKELINELGKNELHLQFVVIFGYSFNIAELRELESGLQQLDYKVYLTKRY